MSDTYVIRDRQKKRKKTFFSTDLSRKIFGERVVKQKGKPEPTVEDGLQEYYDNLGKPENVETDSR